MSKRILVVEDQPDSRQIIRDRLAATDYEITEAENGEQALAAVTERRPDLILMDVQLPIMDGYEATNAFFFSRHERCMSTPSIAGSASRMARHNLWPYFTVPAGAH
jgi:CheY-like chemotaxis protein